MKKVNNNLKDYLRVGTEYYRKVQIPLKNDTITALQSWTKQTIKDDFGNKKYNPIYDIKKYTGFCFVPGHGDDYQQEINGFYNQYEKLKWEPKKGNCENTLEFLKHIFGDQLELGLDYLALLYLKPDHILPILCLVSDERNTGKSTFVKWMKRIFEGNMTINTNEEFRARFNNDWINRLIIAVEETLLEKKEDSERIKALSTGDQAKVEKKGIDKIETAFYGKFILCSNNEKNFIKIDQSEIRYWVRKIETPNSDNTNLKDDMVKEIPAFLYYVNGRGILSQKKSRMWFSPEEIWTEALAKLKGGNRSSAQREIEEIVLEKMNDFNLDEIRMTLADLYDELKHMRLQKAYIKEVLQEKMKMKPLHQPLRYKLWSFAVNPNDSSDMIPSGIDKKGRYYTFKRSQFESDKLHLSKNVTKTIMTVTKSKVE